MGQKIAYLIGGESDILLKEEKGNCGKGKKVVDKRKGKKV